MLTDLHIHSTASHDAHDCMKDMALAAYERGVRIICFTDHVDLDDYNTGTPDIEAFGNYPEMLRQHAETRLALPHDMELLHGIELGEANHDPQRAAEIASSPELDFVIGSLHNLRNVTDFSVMRYDSMADCRRYIDLYAKELVELSLTDCYDVMAHIGYTRRYMLRDGFDISVSLETHRDQLDLVFRNLIHSGRGIELNCSGLRSPGIHDTFPDRRLLNRYKELGGEIITLGSDAHCTADAAVGIDFGLELLRETGFKYCTVFRQRKPEFIKI